MQVLHTNPTKTANHFLGDIAKQELLSVRNRTKYGYDDRGRLVSVDSGSVIYAHNGQGQRVKKDDSSTITLFAYDEAGQLIGEYDDTGTAVQETVWFNGAPVAVLVGSNKYYVHTDHLGTPRAISNGNTVIWRWESDPFGTTAPQEDPDGDLTDIVYNLRFPGQYFDSETGLHYNYFRTYDPSTGRYLESDPIGLQGGLNTYGYVGGNPLAMIDPLGLVEWPWPFAGRVSNESKDPVPISGTESGIMQTEVVPPGTPDDPSKSPGGIDWDFAWVNCTCWKIGPGELDVGENGVPKRWQILHGPAPEKACRNIEKPPECQSCSI